MFVAAPNIPGLKTSFDFRQACEDAAKYTSPNSQQNFNEHFVRRGPGISESRRILLNLHKIG
jgi:hypothetical protein